MAGTSRRGTMSDMHLCTRPHRALVNALEEGKSSEKQARLPDHD